MKKKPAKKKITTKKKTAVKKKKPTKKKLVTRKVKRSKSITSKENGRKGGRPAKDETIEKNLDKFLELISLGATDEQIGVALDMHVHTVAKYKKHDRFLEAVERSGKFAKASIRRAIFKRALGYTHSEEKIFCDKGRIIRAKTIKHYPPDMGAADMFMRNKDEKWKGNRAEINVNNTNVNKVTANATKPEEVTDEMRERTKRNIEVLKRNGLLNDKASK